VPGFLPHFATVLQDLRHEARTAHLGADGLSPSGNLRWYLATAIPDALGWPVALLTLAGAVLVTRERRTKALSLLVLVAVFLGSVSLSSLHWERWIIPLLPVLALLAAVPLVRFFRALGARKAEHRAVLVVTVSLGLLLASMPRASRLVRTGLQQLEPSTRVRARAWVLEHLPPGSRIAEEWYAAPLVGTGFLVTEHFSLAALPGPGFHIPPGSLVRDIVVPDVVLEDYARAGYDFLIVSSAIYGRYLAEPSRYPAEVAFYSHLFREDQLLQEFLPSTTSRGPAVSIYRITPAPG
jgi:hypothetical protein